MPPKPQTRVQIPAPASILPLAFYIFYYNIFTGDADSGPSELMMRILSSKPNLFSIYFFLHYLLENRRVTVPPESPSMKQGEGKSSRYRINEVDAFNG